MHQQVEDPNVDKVRTKILNRLGRPPTLHAVTCVNTFDNKWRVNVWTRTYSDTGVPENRIAHSYFCEMTKGGTLRCNPKIEKTYGRESK